MYVCICHAVTERDIYQAVDAGARCLREVQKMTKVSTCCGACSSRAEECIACYSDVAAFPDLIPLPA